MLATFLFHKSPVNDSTELFLFFKREPGTVNHETQNMD